MTIEPDTKDWTWVLGRPCPECGFDTQAFPRERVGTLLRENAAAWPTTLGQFPDVRARPNPGTWSPLEYACHVRDVFRIYDRRLELMLTEDDAHFDNWDQDETAVSERYNEQAPAEVSRDLVDAADALASRFDTVDGDQWRRRGARSDGASFTIDTFARYMVHDPVHHLHDVVSSPDGNQITSQR